MAEKHCSRYCREQGDLSQKKLDRTAAALEQSIKVDPLEDIDLGPAIVVPTQFKDQLLDFLPEEYETSGYHYRPDDALSNA